ATGVCFTMFSGMAAAEEEKPTANLTVGAFSQYIWRGFELSKDSIVIQPSMTVAYKGFSANLWGNLDTDPYLVDEDNGSNSWTETDMTLAYAWDMDPVAFSVGYIYYGLDILSDSQEFYVSASLKTILKPTLSIYRDVDSYQGWYVTLGVSHSIPVKDDITLDLGAQVGYMSVDNTHTEDSEVYFVSDAPDDSYNDFHDGVLSVGLTIPLCSYATINPKLMYSFALSDDAEDVISHNYAAIGSGDEDFIYGGVSVTMTF
ncbi:MAG: hypothetical protein J0652_02200, partial [Desulfobulbaceae bacterium]|nr:hypothetical protein [Desulfobulbaceae bacterium]